MDGKNMKRADQTYANQNRFNKINNIAYKSVSELRVGRNDSTLMEQSYTSTYTLDAHIMIARERQ